MDHHPESLTDHICPVHEWISTHTHTYITGVWHVAVTRNSSTKLYSFVTREWKRAKDSTRARNTGED